MAKAYLSRGLRIVFYLAFVAVAVYIVRGVPQHRLSRSERGEIRSRHSLRWICSVYEIFRKERCEEGDPGQDDPDHDLREFAQFLCSDVRSGFDREDLKGFRLVTEQPGRKGREKILAVVDVAREGGYLAVCYSGKVVKIGDAELGELSTAGVLELERPGETR